MASITSENENSDDNLSVSTPTSASSASGADSCPSRVPPCQVASAWSPQGRRNLVQNLHDRQLYGRFARGPKAPLERTLWRPREYTLFSLIHEPNALDHTVMGFTLCGQYMLSYTMKSCNVASDHPIYDLSYEYELYIWRFSPGVPLRFVSKHRIFSHFKSPYPLDGILFMQFPNDPAKIVCYGNESATSEFFHITVLTLPSPSSCIHCADPPLSAEESFNGGWCSRHGFLIHFMFATSQLAPCFDPNISLSYPNHLVVNTGHHVHILNISTLGPYQCNLSHWVKEENPKPSASDMLASSLDAFSEISESASCSSLVDAILEDFSEYDLDSSEGGKPFHELNISCEPLNVTGKTYHNTLVQSIFDPRLKRLQTTSRDYVFSVPHASSQKLPEKNKVVDKKVAEKAYEFIEENEKYEKISLFRKKRLADKKYEFSEDNTENIVPFHILRRERTYLVRSQTRPIRSPDFNSFFLSPRSPMQSPSSRNGQFSPGGARHIYCTPIRSSPYHSRSPISPRETARKVNVYSPSLSSECSDFDGKLILKTPLTSTAQFNADAAQSGLLIVDPKVEASKWIKKVVRRFSNGDFENSSLLSGQSRDDYNNPIEVPLLVQSPIGQMSDGEADKADHVMEVQLIVTQRSLDSEQFVQKQAQIMCLKSGLQFMHYEDYDLKIVHVCPMNGEILCQGVIKVGALKPADPTAFVENYWGHFLFVWNIATDAFDVLDDDSNRLFCAREQVVPRKIKCPNFHCASAWVLAYDMSHQSLDSLRDPQGYFEIVLQRRFSGDSDESESE